MLPGNHDVGARVPVGRSLTVLGPLLLAVTPAFAIRPETRVIAQPSAPLKITSYTAIYLEGGRYDQRGIHHNVGYINSSDRPIVAVQIGLVAFDVWNEFLSRTSGLALEDLEPGAAKKGAWVARAYADFSFHTGVAFVNKVRFADGTFWTADLDVITEELRKIESDFDVSKLNEKPEKE